jgi:hypothetical protein
MSDSILSPKVFKFSRITDTLVLQESVAEDLNDLVDIILVRNLLECHLPPDSYQNALDNLFGYKPILVDLGERVVYGIETPSGEEVYDQYRRDHIYTRAPLREGEYEILSGDIHVSTRPLPN